LVYVFFFAGFDCVLVFGLWSIMVVLVFGLLVLDGLAVWWFGQISGLVVWCFRLVWWCGGGLKFGSVRTVLLLLSFFAIS
jgi:hypothetical protein